MDAARELVRRDRIETREGHVFYIDEAVLDRAEISQAKRQGDRPRGRLTADVERGLLRAVGLDAVSRLDCKAAMLRSDLTFDAWGGQDDSFALAIEEDRALAVICRSLALRGSSARVDAERRAELSALGFSGPMIDRIADQMCGHARREQYGSWNIGPTYEQTAGMLSDAGVDPGKPNLARLRRSSLLLLAYILDDVDRRYERPPLEVASIYAEVLGAEDLPRTAQAGSTPPKLGTLEPDLRTPSRSNRALARDDTPAFRPLNPDPAEPTVNAGPPPSLLRLTEDLILTKATGKSGGWEPKTANQHRSIVKLLAKVAGTDDPREISQTHIGKYFSTLAVIPKHYGKSSKDEGRSIEEILARAEELEDEDIGLEAGTINRHQTQLGNILSHLKGNGFQCGQAFPSFRRPETESPDEKRSPFSVEEGQTFFANPVYTGCKGDEARLEVGSLIIHDALYWIPLIAWYGLMRLSEIAGLMLTDVDFPARAFIVADNQIRRIKTPQSKRRVPFHPELIRLGLLDYLSEINRLGYDVVFPDLKLRGVKTPMGALFYKVFRPALDQALPHASQQRITLHSTRKTGNTAMIAGKVIDPTRHRVMGHQIPGVNGRHYTAPLPDEVLLEALMHIPVVTHGVRCSPIRLASGLKNVNEVPTSK